jgi:ABC-type dipeptide/oligopeptide/nickel transport system permease component
VKIAKVLATRLLYGLFSLIFISFVVFMADEAAPGDRATVEMGEKARPEMVQQRRHELGLDRPWPIRYVEFVAGAAKLDFGKSWVGTKQPVSEQIAAQLPMTGKIALLAILLAAAVGITLGTVAAVWQNKFPDGAVLTLSTLGVTVPNFVLAPVLGYLFAVVLDRLPLTYSTPNTSEFERLVLPVFILSLRPMALLTRLTRASMIETLGQEFMKTAVAKGVPFWRRMLVHGLRNAITPVVTAVGTSFGFLLTGSFVVETAFGINGLGKAGIDAILSGDMPMVQATVLLGGGLFILVNLVVDLLGPILDPRMREAAT